MSIIAYEIVSKARRCPAERVSPRDFKLRAQGELTLQDVINNANLSLYCLDDEKRLAYFVEVPKHADLFGQRFLFQAQFEYAQRVVALGYSQLTQLANAIDCDAVQLIFLYAMRRSGGEFLRCLMLLEEDVVSLNQPYVYSQIQSFSTRGGLRSREISHLLEVCTRILCTHAVQRESSKNVMLSFRDYNFQLSERLIKLYPMAKSILLYRDALSYTQEIVSQSYHKGIPAFYLAVSKSIVGRKLYQMALSLRRKRLRRLYPLLQDYPSKIYRNYGELGFIVFTWLSIMDQFLRLYRRSLPVMPVRYNALLSDSVAVMAELAEYCGFTVRYQQQEVLEVQTELMRRGKLGTAASPKLLREKDCQRVQALVQAHPQINDVHFILPRRE